MLRQVLLTLGSCVSVVVMIQPALGCPAGWRLNDQRSILPVGGGGEQAGLNGIGWTILVLPDAGSGTGPDLLVGGVFTSAGGLPTARMARFHTATGAWSSIPASPAGTMGLASVLALAAAADGDVFVGGSYRFSATNSAGGVFRYRPSSGGWVPLRGGAVGDGPLLATAVTRSVNELLVLPGGESELIVGGNFSSVADVSAVGVARYRPNIGAWSAVGPVPGAGAGFNPGLNGSADAMVILPGGDVLVGGGFDVAGGVAARGLARYAPGTNTWSPVNAALRGTVRAMAVLPGGDVLVAGLLSGPGGAGLGQRIGRYSPATDTWSPQTWSMDGIVSALTVLPDGDVVAGGFFTSAGGTPAARIARLSASTGVWSPLGTGTDGGVLALAFLPDAAGGQLYVAGEFSSAGGSPSPYFARYRPGSACRADFNCSATVGVNDVLEFVAAWFATPDDPRADIDNDGARSVDDIFIFLNLWFAGC